jgi:hypothetical protein
VVEQLLLAQHGVNRLGHGGALARPQTLVLAKKTGHDGVGGVVELEREANQLGAGV